MANRLFVPLILTLLIALPLSSLAASGGRMGGRSASTSSSSQSTPASSSHSTPSRSSFSGSSYYPPSSYDSYHYYPRRIHHHFWPPVPEKEVPATTKEATLDFKRIAVVLVVLLAAVLGLCYFVSSQKKQSLSSQKKRRVFKLQVGLLGKAKSLQNELNRIAETADTSTSKGLSYILTETTVALSRHSKNFISAYAFEDVKRNTREWEKWLSESSIEQRGKFDEETLVNVDNKRTRQTTTRTIKGGFNDEYIVVTVLVVAQGEHELPTIKYSEDLKEALTLLGSIPSRDVEAVEVLWTPQADNDILSEEEYREDYPLLASIYRCADYMQE